MNAPIDRLHADLADLAEQVTIVDLRDRTLRTSHNLGVRRTAVAAVVAVVVLAIGAGTAVAGLPDRHPPVPGTGQSDLPTTAPASPSSSPSATPTGPVPGIYFYRSDTADGTNTTDLLYRAPGRQLAEGRLRARAGVPPAAGHLPRPPAHRLGGGRPAADQRPRR
jgi:hypothetical protein